MKRHKLAESVPAKSVSRKDTDCWEIQSMSETGKVHCVRRISSSICTCLLRCSLCMACVHSFDCTCLDYAIRGVDCTHIHAVSMAEPIIDSKESELPNSTSVEEIRDDLANLVPINKETKKFTEIEDVRRNALSVIAELTDIIQCAPSSDTIHAGIRHVRSAISVARGLPVIGTDHQSSYNNTPSDPKFLYSPIQNPCHFLVIFFHRNIPCLISVIFFIKKC